MEDVIGAMIPIFICAILPIAVVLIIFRSQMNSDNKRAEVLMKAIETNNNIDAEKLSEAFQKRKPTALEMSNNRLQRGVIFSLVGAALLIIDVVETFAGGWRDDIFQGLTLFGSIFFAVGLGYLIVYFVTRKQVGKHNEE